MTDYLMLADVIRTAASNAARGLENDRYKMRAELREAFEGKPERGSCPCLFTEPCTTSCTCVNPMVSGGCSRCCTYGSDEQRKENAERIAAAINMAENKKPEPNRSCTCHPDDNPPEPCARKYALSECKKKPEPVYETAEECVEAIAREGGWWDVSTEHRELHDCMLKHISRYRPCDRKPCPKCGYSAWRVYVEGGGDAFECEVCNMRNQRNDAVLMEKELKAKLKAITCDRNAVIEECYEFLLNDANRYWTKRDKQTAILRAAAGVRALKTEGRK